MTDWQIVLSVAGSQILVAVAVLGLVWRVMKTYRKEVATYKEEAGELRNDVAWVNKDLAEVKKDVEWLVWHFKQTGG